MPLFKTTVSPAHAITPRSHLQNGYVVEEDYLLWAEDPYKKPLTLTRQGRMAFAAFSKALVYANQHGYIQSGWYGPRTERLSNWQMEDSDPIRNNKKVLHRIQVSVQDRAIRWWYREVVICEVGVNHATFNWPPDLITSYNHTVRKVLRLLFRYLVFDEPNQFHLDQKDYRYWVRSHKGERNGHVPLIPFVHSMTLLSDGRVLPTETLKTQVETNKQQVAPLVEISFVDDAGKEIWVQPSMILDVMMNERLTMNGKTKITFASSGELILNTGIHFSWNPF